QAMVASMVCFVNGKPDKRNYRKYRIKHDSGNNDIDSIKEVISRAYREEAIRKNMPDLILVDGGAGQVSAAKSILNDYGLPGQPLIGLAKKHEHIYLSNSAKPVIISRGSSALRLLQRIRNEAHRFAVAYHKSLRKAVQKKSALDEIKGLGEQRKMLLLKKFGSIKNLKKQDKKSLMQIPGIGGKLANTIFEALSGNQ
ncbi:MAG: helix-hairpin-helix domain-containing protein, partial [bacterium]